MPFYLDPALWPFLLALLSGFAVRWRGRAAVGLVLVCIAMVVLGSPALSNVWLSSLERQQPLHACTVDSASTVVVLGGGLDTRYPVQQTAERLSETSWRRALSAVPVIGPDSVVVLSGGGRNLGGDGVTEADAMAALLTPLIPDTVRLLRESRSRNTFDNARLSAEVLDTQGVVGPVTLVTSAAHMPRAGAVFAKHGFDLCRHAVAPEGQPVIPRFALLPQVTGYQKSYVAVREWVAFAVYRWRSWI